MLLSSLKKQRMTVGDILSHSWAIYKNHFVDILVISLIVNVPLDIVAVFIPIELIYYALTSLVGVLATMAIALVVEQSLLGEGIRFGQALSKSVSRWGSAIGTNIVKGLILVGLTLLLIIPGIIWGVYYTFSSMVVVLRNRSGKSALDYSKSLVQGQWSRVFGVNFVLVLILFLPLVVQTFVVKSFLQNSSLIILLAIVGIILTHLASTFSTVAVTLLFLNIDYQRHAFQKPQKMVGTENASATTLDGSANASVARKSAQRTRKARGGLAK
jgi:hypothetical protein